MTTTAAARACAAAVVVCGVIAAGPALAHDDGLTPYRYVQAPAGVASEGAAEAGTSTQPLGAFGFAGTTDNQMQLTFPEGALTARAGEQGVRVQLDQLDPADLPPLPAGLEPEGNGYRVTMAYVPSGAPVATLGAPATLGLAAPAAPTLVYELRGGEWAPVDFTPLASEEGFSSSVVLTRPGTFLQVYDPSTAPAVQPVAEGQPRSTTTTGQMTTVGVALAAVLALAGIALLLRRRSRA